MGKADRSIRRQRKAELLKQLEMALKSRGTLDVLRHGLKLIPNIQLRFCFFQPASGLNAELVALYESNRLTVIRQLKYSQKNENAIDVGLFLNAIRMFQRDSEMKSIILTDEKAL